MSILHRLTDDECRALLQAAHAFNAFVPDVPAIIRSEQDRADARAHVMDAAVYFRGHLGTIGEHADRLVDHVKRTYGRALSQ